MAEYLEPQLKVELLNKIIEECSKNSLPALKSELTNYGWMKWGSHRTTIMEYLKRLQVNKDIVINGDEIWTFNRWEKIKLAKEKDYLKMMDLFENVR